MFGDLRYQAKMKLPFICISSSKAPLCVVRRQFSGGMTESGMNHRSRDDRDVLQAPDQTMEDRRQHHLAVPIMLVWNHTLSKANLTRLRRRFREWLHTTIMRAVWDFIMRQQAHIDCRVSSPRYVHCNKNWRRESIVCTVHTARRKQASEPRRWSRD